MYETFSISEEAVTASYVISTDTDSNVNSI